MLNNFLVLSSKLDSYYFIFFTKRVTYICFIIKHLKKLPRHKHQLIVH